MEAADSQGTHQEYLKINFIHPLHEFLVCCLLPQLLEVSFSWGTQEPGEQGNGQGSQDSFSTWQCVKSSAL